MHHLRLLTVDLTIMPNDAQPFIGPSSPIPVALMHAVHLEGLRMSVNRPLTNAWASLSGLPALSKLWLHQRAPVVDVHQCSSSSSSSHTWRALEALNVTATEDVELVVIFGHHAPCNLKTIYVSDYPLQPSDKWQRRRGVAIAPTCLLGLSGVLVGCTSTLHCMDMSCDLLQMTRNCFRRMCQALSDMLAVKTIRLNLTGGLLPARRWSSLCRGLASLVRRCTVEALELGSTGDRMCALWRLFPERSVVAPHRLPLLRLTLGVRGTRHTIHDVVMFVLHACQRLVDRMELKVLAGNNWTPANFESLRIHLSSFPSVSLSYEV
jgi:hypothetical protein